MRYAQIASLAAFAVALLCLIAWLFKLSMLVRLVSDSILVGFKAGAGLTIIMSQLPSLFGVAGGGHNFFDRAIRLAGQARRHQSARVGDWASLRSCSCCSATGFCRAGRSDSPWWRCRSCWQRLFGLPSLGIPVTGNIPEGLPAFQVPTFGLLEFEELFPLAAGCLLLAYIEGVSAARSFAAKHGYSLDVRQEFLGLGAANLAVAFGHGYPVAGGLSQSAVNDTAGARTPLALVVCSCRACALPAVLHRIADQSAQGGAGGIVFAAVYKLVDVRALIRMWQGQPDRLLRRGDRAGVRAAARNPARRPACRARIHLPAAGPRVAARTSRFSGGFPEPAAIPTAPGTRAWSRWSVLSRSAPKPRCSTSMPRRSWIRF